MIPLVGDRAGARAGAQADIAAGGRRDRGRAPASRPDFKVGTMIELPRAVMAAGEIAGRGRVLLLRHQRPDPDDVGVLPRRRRGVVLLAPTSRRASSAVSPFESLDTEGVGGLVRHAVEQGRAARPDLHLGVCGEHGGDPDSIHFFDEVGPRLRLLLAVPGAGRAAGGRPVGRRASDSA